MVQHEPNDLCKEMFAQLKDHITESVPVRADVEKSKERINSLEKRLDGFDSLRVAVYGTLFAIIIQTGAICFYAGRLSNQVLVDTKRLDKLEEAVDVQKRINKEYVGYSGDPVVDTSSRTTTTRSPSTENVRGSNPHDLDYVGGL